MSLRRGNLFQQTPEPGDGELVEDLVAGQTFRLERMTSTGQTTPPGKWYDQAADEFVVLLSGSASLRFDEPIETIDLRPGDWLLIPARRRHRVDRTSAESPSVWLAIHFQH